MTASAAAVMTKPPFGKVNWLPREIDVDRREDGVIVMKSRFPRKHFVD